MRPNPLPADLYDAARNGSRRLDMLGHRASVTRHYGRPAVLVHNMRTAGLTILPMRGRRGRVYWEVVGNGNRYPTIHLAVTKELLNRSVFFTDGNACLRPPEQWCHVCAAVLTGTPPFTKETS